MFILTNGDHLTFVQILRLFWNRFKIISTQGEISLYFNEQRSTFSAVFSRESPKKLINEKILSKHNKKHFSSTMEDLSQRKTIICCFFLILCILKNKIHIILRKISTFKRIFSLRKQLKRFPLQNGNFSFKEDDLLEIPYLTFDQFERSKNLTLLKNKFLLL